MLNLHAPFRRATPDDARAILDLVNGAGRITAGAPADIPLEGSVVADEGGRVFAALVGRPAKNQDTWRIDALAVAPDRSFDEFGARLLALADALAADEGIFSVSLMAETANDEVRAILDREGFRADGAPGSAAGQGAGGGVLMTRPVVPQG